MGWAKMQDDAPKKPYLSPVGFRPPNGACGAEFFFFFSGTASKKSPGEAAAGQRCLFRRHRSSVAIALLSPQ
jgi:hypothetical protein